MASHTVNDNDKPITSPELQGKFCIQKKSSAVVYSIFVKESRNSQGSRGSLTTIWSQLCSKQHQLHNYARRSEISYSQVSKKSKDSSFTV